MLLNNWVDKEYLSKLSAFLCLVFGDTSCAFSLLGVDPPILFTFEARLSSCLNVMVIMDGWDIIDVTPKIMSPQFTTIKHKSGFYFSPVLVKSDRKSLSRHIMFLR